MQVLNNLFGDGKALLYFCQDETRFGLLTKTGRLITLKGVKPEGVYQWGRKTFWLYGAVEPLTGNSFFTEFESLNGDCFQRFLDKFSSHFEGYTIILQMDKASAHTTQDIDWPENIIPICQPSYSPELNPIERLWEYIKSQIKWETFADLDALRQRIQQILHELSPAIVQSITGWDLFLDALLSSSS